jgi:hypothetical protein
VLSRVFCKSKKRSPFRQAEMDEMVKYRLHIKKVSPSFFKSRKDCFFFKRKKIYPKLPDCTLCPARSHRYISGETAVVELARNCRRGQKSFAQLFQKLA